MNWVRESVEGNYIWFKETLGVSGIELMEFPLFIVFAAFIFGAVYTIARTLTQIDVHTKTFTEKNFIIGSLFFALAVFNSWAVFYMDLVLDWYDMTFYMAYALGAVWLFPAIAGLCFFEEWKKQFLNPNKKGIRQIPDWVLPVGLFIVTFCFLFSLVTWSIEYSLNMDCSLIGTSEDTKLTEQEAVKLRESCESVIDNSYIFGWVVLPIMAVAMVSSILVPLLRYQPENEGWHP